MGKKHSKWIWRCHKGYKTNRLLNPRISSFINKQTKEDIANENQGKDKEEEDENNGEY